MPIGSTPNDPDAAKVAAMVDQVKTSIPQGSNARASHHQDLANQFPGDLSIQGRALRLDQDQLKALLALDPRNPRIGQLKQTIRSLSGSILSKVNDELSQGKAAYDQNPQMGLAQYFLAIQDALKYLPMANPLDSRMAGLKDTGNTLGQALQQEQSSVFGFTPGMPDVPGFPPPPFEAPTTNDTSGSSNQSTAAPAFKRPMAFF